MRKKINKTKKIRNGINIILSKSKILLETSVSFWIALLLSTIYITYVYPHIGNGHTFIGFIPIGILVGILIAYNSKFGWLKFSVDYSKKYSKK